MMDRPSTVAITGSTGLVGTALAQRLRDCGHEVIALVRGEPTRPIQRHWGTDGCNLSGVNAVVHLAGESIASGLWTPERKRRILESRREGTLAIAHACREQGVRLISASAVGFYGSRDEERLEEASLPGTGFLSEVCQAWEEAAGPESTRLRFGQILSWNGGALAVQAKLYRMGLGARLGSGRQWMPWISVEDAVEVLVHVLQARGTGAYNVVSPAPSRQIEFHDLMCARLHRPRFPVAPGWLLERLPGGFGRGLLLSGAHVLPDRLRTEGFAWSHPDLKGFLAP